MCKWKDNRLVGGVVAINTVTKLGTLSDVVQGSGTVQRIGDQYLVDSLELRVLIQPNIPLLYAQGANSSFAPGGVRIAVVLDQQASSATVPAYTDIFTDAAINAPQRMDEFARFSVLHDQYYSFFVNPFYVTGSNNIMLYDDLLTNINVELGGIRFDVDSGDTSGAVHFGNRLLFYMFNSQLLHAFDIFSRLLWRDQ